LLFLPSICCKVALFNEELDQPQPHDEEKQRDCSYGITTDHPW